jgi:hypothetical protein
MFSVFMSNAGESGLSISLKLNYNPFGPFLIACVADPDLGSGIKCIFNPGSGIRNRFFPDPGYRIPDPKNIFFRALELG